MLINLEAAKVSIFLEKYDFLKKDSLFFSITSASSGDRISGGIFGDAGYGALHRLKSTLTAKWLEAPAKCQRERA
jgi:hypothetical protein